MSNPFELVTASKLSAEKAVELWCDDKRLERVWGKENCFVNGHRGTGKSMLFRILQYDCQKILNPLKEPDFLGIYFSVRDSELMTEELDLFQEDSQRNILSESHFSILILRQLFSTLNFDWNIINNDSKENFIGLLKSRVEIAYQFSTFSSPPFPSGEIKQVISYMLDLFEIERQRIVTYTALRLYNRENFSGPLFLFDTLLGPIGDFIHSQAGKTLYILIDDADDLPESHTISLNTWIARRTVSIVFKVSTMFGYKTYQTRGRSAIQHPHDFVQYEIATRYLSDRTEDYIDLLKQITQKRLTSVGIQISPEIFFPEDAEQKRQLKIVENKLFEEYAGAYKGRAINDYVYRHLTSEYIKRVLVPKRATQTYSYSGFHTLATLSGGMVRDFIICAQKMYDIESRNSSEPTAISPQTQNAVVREHADILLSEIVNAKQKRKIDTTKHDWQIVGRLITGLGAIFKAKMLSDDSERRVFSFSIQDDLPPDIERLLDLAISEGYLTEGFISRKEGTGRRSLYVLTRRLAPAFNLDVKAYSGYLSLSVERLRELIANGHTFGEKTEKVQLNLFTSNMEFIDSVPASSAVSTEPWLIISSEAAGK